MPRVMARSGNAPGIQTVPQALLWAPLAAQDQGGSHGTFPAWIHTTFPPGIHTEECGWGRRDIKHLEGGDFQHPNPRPPVPHSLEPLHGHFPLLPTSSRSQISEEWQETWEKWKTTGKMFLRNLH